MARRQKSDPKGKNKENMKAGLDQRDERLVIITTVVNYMAQKGR
jgi:hypothetical protein